MAPLGPVSLLMVTLAALCDAQPTGERPARWHPPPMVSFLRQLWGAQRGPLRVAPAPWKPRWYVQPDAAGEALGLPRSPRHRTRRQLPPLPPGRGCQLGTCQTHNLFSWLYHISASDLKDGSRKDMADPMGYGRRRRWAAGRGAPAGT